MSYRDPPMQTIPSRGEGAELRNIVASTPGTFLVRADLGQMEYRLLAHFTQDKFLMDAYKTGRDLHEETGKLFGVSRDAGKQCNFSVIYGQGISALSAKIKKSKEETSKLMQQYFERFSKVKDFKDNVINYAYANKHIRTMSGRIRGLSRYMEYEDGSIERLAVNTVIQGANADMIKMIICKQRRLFRDTDIKCILQVHDELIFEFPNSYDRKKAENMIEKLMTETYPLSIPVEASVLSGNNWSEAKD
jgi:DNA polymerase-1